MWQQPTAGTSAMRHCPTRATPLPPPSQPAHLGERALAGAVLAHDGMHLALPHCRRGHGQWNRSARQRRHCLPPPPTLPPAAALRDGRRAAPRIPGQTAWLPGAASDAHSPVSVTPLRICCPVAAILACRSCTSSSTSPAAARVTRRAARCTRVARWHRSAAAGRGAPTLQAAVHAMLMLQIGRRSGRLRAR